MNCLDSDTGHSLDKNHPNGKIPLQGIQLATVTKSTAIPIRNLDEANTAAIDSTASIL